MRVGIRLGLYLLIVVTTMAGTDKIAPLNVKLGLWQMTYILEGNGIPAPTIPPELAAKMTPEQRAKTEAKLKARAGSGPRFDSKRYCLTEQKLNEARFSDDDSKSCQRTIVASTAKMQQFHEECSAGAAKRTTEGRFEAVDANTVTGTLQLKIAGKTTLTIKSDIAGRWIGADCGDESP